LQTYKSLANGPQLGKQEAQHCHVKGNQQVYGWWDESHPKLGGLGGQKHRGEVSIQRGAKHGGSDLTGTHATINIWFDYFK
jgi:hypothetical protein